MKVCEPQAEYNGNPQIEDGYTRIANELLDAMLAFKFTARQYKVIWSVMRKTYGFNKKADDISLSQISIMAVLPRNHVCQEISALVAMNVVTKTPGTFGNILGINKKYQEWIHIGAKAKTSSDPLDRSNHHHYIYRITRTQTGEFYVGVRSCRCLPEQDRYLGSGNWVSVQPKRELSKEIISKHETRELAEIAEATEIRKHLGNEKNMNRRMYFGTSKDIPAIGTQSVNNVGTESVPSTQSGPVTESVNGVGTQSVNDLSTQSVNQVGTESGTTKDNSKRQSKDTTKRQLPKAPLSEAETALKIACRKTWDAYGKAYFEKYGTEPTGNAKVYSQVKGFVKSVPYADAPHIASWFLDHTDSFYVRKGHDFGLLLADAGKLRTEWITGKRMNGTRARQVERAGNGLDIVNEILQERATR